MANLYFDESLTSGDLVEGALVTIAGDEARHAVRVSRLRIGEQTMIGDGAGSIASGVVETVDRDRFTVRIASVRTIPKHSPRLILAQALAKGDRDERAVEQATEFGVDAIMPWQADRSVSRWGGSEKAAKGVSKWERIAREASKQSIRGWIPEILPPGDINELARRAANDCVLVLHPRGESKLSSWKTGGESRDIIIVVGPEGGFSDAELDTLEAAGAQVLQLGDTVLRTSSAGPAALAALNVSLGRW